MSFKRLLSQFSLSIFFTALPLVAVAEQGGSHGGGGNVVLCQGRPAMVLDYYNATIGTVGGDQPELLNLSNLTEQQTIAALLGQLGLYLDYRIELNQALDKIGPIEKWLSADLKQMDDSGEPYFLPPGCARRTGAYRENPLTMYGDPSVISQLSPGQRGVLRFHEAVYLVAAQKIGATTSIQVRSLMQALLKKEKPFYANIEDKVRAVGGDTRIDVQGTAFAVGTYFISDDNGRPIENQNQGFRMDYAPGGDLNKLALSGTAPLLRGRTIVFDCSAERREKADAHGSCVSLGNSPGEAPFLLQPPGMSRGAFLWLLQTPNGSRMFLNRGGD